MVKRDGPVPRAVRAMGCPNEGAQGVTWHVASRTQMVIRTLDPRAPAFFLFSRIINGKGVTFF